MTPLMYATREGYLEIAEVLINNGANVNDKDNGGKFKILIDTYTNKYRLCTF